MVLNLSETEERRVIFFLQNVINTLSHKREAQQRIYEHLLDIIPNYTCLIRHVSLLFQFSSIHELIILVQAGKDITFCMHKVLDEAEHVYGLSLAYFSPALMLFLKSLNMSSNCILYYFNSNIKINSSSKDGQNFYSELQIALTEIERQKSQYNMLQAKIDSMQLELNAVIKSADYWKDKYFCLEDSIKKQDDVKLKTDEYNVDFHVIKNEGFYDKYDGTVVDSRTRLRWMRYCVGCDWDNGRFTGKPAAFSRNFVNSKSDDIKIWLHFYNKKFFPFNRRWRVPTLHEFDFLFSFCCSRDVVFPGLQDGFYVTADYSDSRLIEYDATSSIGSTGDLFNPYAYCYIVLCLDPLISFKKLK